MGYARFVGTEFRAAAARPLRRGSVYDEPLRIPAAQGVKRRITCMNLAYRVLAKGRHRHILRLLSSRPLPCGCLAGLYETYAGPVVSGIRAVRASGVHDP